MPLYSFNAVSKQGEPYSGKQEAKDKRELAQSLRQEGYILISANLEQSRSKKFDISSLLEIRRVSLTEKLIFTRNLQVMIGAGISLPRALKILANQVETEKFRNALLELSKEITKGKNFADALKEYPNIFSELFVNMIKVGEEAGTLGEILGNLSFQMEREHELRSRVKGAMVYPMIIIATMFGIGILMLVTVVPGLAKTFEELGVELPFTTQLVINLGAFLSEKWYLVILLSLVLGLFCQLGLKTKQGKKIISRFVLKIPVVSSIVKKTNAASTVRTLAALIKSGAPIVRSLEIISRTLDNFYFKEALIAAARKVEKGEKLSQALKSNQDIYPGLVIEMIEVGEETGKTVTVLTRLADFYEEEVSNATKNLSVVIEPALMLVIGAAVGFFAISMIQPMYSMLGTI